MRRTLIDIVCALALATLIIAIGVAGQPSRGSEDYHVHRTWFMYFKATGLAGLLLLFSLAWALVKLVRCRFGLGEARLCNPVVASRIRPLLEGGEVEQAHALSQADSTYSGRLLSAALARRSAGRDEMRKGMTQAAALESSLRMGEVGSLLTTGIVAILLGLLGTATGLMTTFQIVEMLRYPTPADVAVGVYESLVTLALGILVAIFCLPAYFWLKRRFSTRTLEINAEIGELLARTKLPA